MFKVDYAETDASSLVDVGGCGGLVDGALDSGAGAVGPFPGVGLLLAAGVAEDFGQRCRSIRLWGWVVMAVMTARCSSPHTQSIPAIINRLRFGSAASMNHPAPKRRDRPDVTASGHAYASINRTAAHRVTETAHRRAGMTSIAHAPFSFHLQII
ncbi:hypothetical protein ACNAW0_19130 [Micromonospora sp. SL1-18]|uniref:hypothetical protein n=1 Tax=Micromonospora sp. SL1-18 TaxID=3399128 RepID=UPI003A4E0D0C